MLSKSLQHCLFFYFFFFFGGGVVGWDGAIELVPPCTGINGIRVIHYGSNLMNSLLSYRGLFSIKENW